MTLKQVRLEANPTVSITNTQTSKDLIGAASSINLAGGTQNLTPTGLDFVTSTATQFNTDRIPFVAPSDVVAWSGEFRYNSTGTGGAFVTATARVGALRTTTAGEYPVQFRVSIANVLAPQDSAGATITAVGTPSAMTPNQFYLLRVLSSRTAGSVEVLLQSLDGTTTLGTWRKTSGATLGAGPVVDAELGMSSQNQIGTITWHKLQFDDGATSHIPIWVDAVSLSGSMAPLTADTGVQRTLTINGTGPATPVAVDVDWGDGLAHDTGNVTPGTPATFTRTPSVAGNKTATISWGA